jgi:DnaJ-class molecular chaperone
MSRIPEQLRTARFGCGFRRIGNNSGQMALVKRDYYEVLGVSPDADDETIKRAFHELARDWHPDVADAPEAEARFRELAEAYSVLSKRESRVLYDRFGYRGRGNAAFDEMVPVVDVARGENIHADLELRSFEAEAGTRRVISFHAIVRCPSCMGSGTLEPDAEPCPQCDGRGTVETERRLRLRIPPGAVDDGALLRVAGDGNDAGAGSVPGDLLVRVRVVPAPKDPRSVRYIAFALLLVAIVALALYLTR